MKYRSLAPFLWYAFFQIALTIVLIVAGLLLAQRRAEKTIDFAIQSAMRTKFVRLDLDKLITEHTKKEGPQMRTAKERDESAITYSDSVEEAIDIVSKEDNVHIIHTSAILSGVPDYTNRIADTIELVRKENGPRKR